MAGAEQAGKLLAPRANLVLALFAPDWPSGRG